MSRSDKISSDIRITPEVLFACPFFMEIRGNKKDQKLFKEVVNHYMMAREDLDTRIKDWDKKVELFYSHIDENGWPYQSEVFVPQTFTSLFEKMARLNGGKPVGRLVPREGADVVSAKVNNALLSFQWDDASRVDNQPMGAKWALMDLNARIYGASFGLVKWRYETDKNGKVIFDGPTLKVLNNRDCLPNPAYSTVKNWFQYRDYLTIKEMEQVNDVSGGKAKYKNLDALRKSLEESEKGGDIRESNYSPKGKAILGLTDYLGRDESPDFKIIEIIHELRDDRIISFAPKHGVIVRDDENPYKHQRIPIVLLKYIPVDDDIYGLSEIQPIEKIQKALNSLTSQFIDSINMDLYRILQVRTPAVQMHTLEWGPGKIWEMNNPGQDVVPLEHSMASTNQFVNVYTVLTSMLKEAVGETSAATSTLKPFSSEKTATEVRSLETTRSVRDNFNQIFQSEAIKLQTLLWQQMNQQFIFSDPSKEVYILRVVGRDMMNEFKQLGLDRTIGDTSESEMEINMTRIASGMEPDIKQVPLYPVSVNGETVPKFNIDQTGEGGELYIVPEDLVGVYDFMIDVEPMASFNGKEEITALQQALYLFENPNIIQQLTMERKQVKMSEILTDFFEKLGLKGAEKYFAESNYGQETQPAGNEAGTGGGAPSGAQGIPGMGGSGAMAQGAGIPQLG